MEELFVPPDLPIEMIAEEVKESWRLKEVHVEKLMQKVSFPGIHLFCFCPCVQILRASLSAAYKLAASQCAQLA